ncbi:hypothetical protein LMG29542_08572 [Paraburkholderia humisilvae]|uniref:Uncharacterized protein n=1 Tax=Paraburkholderia humisilvae TaxID=627669 RepID=A0A6J5F8L8_9BURK|nr:hypothetical protein LMG29542_08572 [Paraburkholderia humisilvae]
MPGTILADAICLDLMPVPETAWQQGAVHSVLRMRAQRLRERCFIEDEGGPLE